jgi:VanZ family protein
MLLNWLDVRLARLGLALALIAIFLLAVIPQQQVPASSGWDKIDHWLAFFTLALLADRAAGARWFWPRAVPLLLLYGVAIEVAQHFTPDRHAELLDVVADSMGILLYCAVRQLSMMRLPRPD